MAAVTIIFISDECVHYSVISGSVKCLLSEAQGDVCKCLVLFFFFTYIRPL